jgi:hypothetical protein
MFLMLKGLPLKLEMSYLKRERVPRTQPTIPKRKYSRKTHEVLVEGKF